MSEENTGILGEKFKKTTICFDERNEEWKGKIFNSILEEGIPFNNVVDLLMKLDDLMDFLGYPQRSTEIRSFQRVERKTIMKKRGRLNHMEMPFDEEQRGKKATFIVKIAFRQNSSWQGEVTWVDENKTEKFRSALELIRLIDSTEKTVDLEENQFL